MEKHEEWGFGFQAKIMLDSVNKIGCRLTTWVLKYPRFIHSEFLTHREFSRNSSSSRAIPIKKFIEQVKSDPAIPVYWGRNQPGMSARSELSNEDKAEAINTWLRARDSAVSHAGYMDVIGIHKQIANRVLEPWMWITVVMSTTNHNNFFALRDHEDAQPEIAHLAKMMKDELNKSIPKKIEAGLWHIPFLRMDDEDLTDLAKIKVSVARCARVSYLNHNGEKSIDDDISLYNKLVSSKPIHASALEHTAMSLSDGTKCGNFIGWIQHRKQIIGESVKQELYTNA